MRKAFMAAAFAAALLAPASALGLTRQGIVATINPGDKTFTCHWKGREWIYKTTDRTVFRIGQKPATFADLKAGHTVTVNYDNINKQNVAYKVAIRPK